MNKSSKRAVSIGMGTAIGAVLIVMAVLLVSILSNPSEPPAPDSQLASGADADTAEATHH